MSADTQLSWFECLEDDEQWQQYEAMLKSQNAADATSTPTQSIQMNMNPDLLVVRLRASALRLFFY